MPIYEYACSGCNIKFEKIQKMSEANITECPVCNGNSVQKLISATSFRLKGSGWYETDFKSSTEIKRNLVSTDEPNNQVSPVAPTNIPAPTVATSAEKPGG